MSNSSARVDAIKDIRGYEGLYGVTEDGRVWGYKKRHWLSQHKTEKGYMRVRLVKNNLGKMFMVHRLVADCCNGKQKTCHGYIWKYKEAK